MRVLISVVKNAIQAPANKKDLLNAQWMEKHFCSIQANYWDNRSKQINQK